MELNLQAHQEQLIRKVTGVGNGAHIFAPKEWINESVLVVRLEKKSIKEEILGMLYPHLDKVIAVLLFGSHARGEEADDSDVDVLVIAKEKFKVDKKMNYDFIVIAEDFLQSAMRLNPIMMYSIFREAKPVINSEYLEKLKKEKINSRLFLPFIKSTKESIKSSEEVLELDKKTGKTASNSVIYSLILRLRGIFIINKLLAWESYSNRLFKNWIIENCKIDYLQVYGAYRLVRDKKEAKDKIPLDSGERLLGFLKEEIKKLEVLIRAYDK